MRYSKSDRRAQRTLLCARGCSRHAHSSHHCFPEIARRAGLPHCRSGRDWSCKYGSNFVQRDFSSTTLRLYTNDDIIGVELGGALKNVIAIAAGILAGLGMGSNSAAGLITRGIAEMTRLAVAAGARRETLAGLSGVGDLVLTCTGSLSRNRTVGLELGRGRKLPEILSGLGGKVAEGVRTTRAARGLALKLGVEMPITEQMGLILDHGKDPREAIRDLMSRPGRDED